MPTTDTLLKLLFWAAVAALVASVIVALGTVVSVAIQFWDQITALDGGPLGFMYGDPPFTPVSAAKTMILPMLSDDFSPSLLGKFAAAFLTASGLLVIARLAVRIGQTG